MERIQYKRYALINDQGVIWEGLTRLTRKSLYDAYKGISGGGQMAALADGWRAKLITIYFDL